MRECSRDPHGQRRPDQQYTQPDIRGRRAAHLDDVYRYLLYLTKDGTLAEDLTADTFERALRALARFDPRRGSARTWLCQLARSTALDHFRAEERRRRRDDRYARDEPAAPRAQLPGLSPALEDALGRLSAADRELIALRIVLELDSPACRTVLGISTTACSTRLSRALTELQEEIDDART